MTRSQPGCLRARSTSTDLRQLAAQDQIPSSLQEQAVMLNAALDEAPV
jgi:hypothetical protein